MLRRTAALLLFAAAVLSMPGQTATDAARGRRGGPARMELPAAAFEPLPRGEDGEMPLVSRAADHGVVLGRTEAVLAGSRGAAPLRMRFAGAAPSAVLEGIDPLPGRSHYLRGRDPRGWRTGVPRYGRARYRGLHPGIDLVFYRRGGRLEFDYVVAPGADPAAIAFDLLREGDAAPLRLDGSGRVVAASDGRALLQAPGIYQAFGGGRRAVAGGFEVRGARRVGFSIGAYDRSRPLVIDPVFAYSTYLGGGGSDQALAIAADAAGNSYVTGTTYSLNFPVAGGIAPHNMGNQDIFVSKIDAAGRLIYSTYLGGAADDGGQGIAVDGGGNAYVTGFSASLDYPTVQPFRRAPDGTYFDAVVSKLDPEGDRLVYSTFLGGSNQELARAIAVDGSGSAHVIGGTMSDDFPTRNAVRSTRGAGQDAFVTKLTPAGDDLVYSTFLGGAGEDVGRGIALQSGNAYVTGTTTSTDFPTANALQPTNAGQEDAFVAELSSAGALVYSTYFGGTSRDYGQSIAVDRSGSATLVGNTESLDFPNVRAYQPTFAGRGTAFVARISSGGGGIFYSTFFGGELWDEAFGVAVDASGNACFTGHTYSMRFPTFDALQGAHAGGVADAYAAKLDASGTALVFSTYLGGSGHDEARGVALDPLGGIHIAGTSLSLDFPVASPLQASTGGSKDAFVARIREPQPQLAIAMSQATYRQGETVTASEFTLSNPARSTRTVRLQLWLKLPWGQQVTLVDAASVPLPGFSRFPLGPLPLLPVGAADPPRGDWELGGRLTDPDAGTSLAEDRNPFRIE